MVILTNRSDPNVIDYLRRSQSSIGYPGVDWATDHMLDRTGLVEVGRVTAHAALRAIGSSVPTFADARRLTDAIVATLGERACVEHENGPQRWVYLRDPEDDAWLVAPAIVDEQGWGPPASPC